MGEKPSLTWRCGAEGCVWNGRLEDGTLARGHVQNMSGVARRSKWYQILRILKIVA